MNIVEKTIRDWHERIAELERQSDAMTALTGSSPESPLMGAIWHAAGHYTELADAVVGGGGWLPWWWLECGLGARSMQASPVGGKLRRVSTVDDLIALVNEEMQGGGQ